MTALHEATGHRAGGAAPATRALAVPGLPRQRSAGSRHGAQGRVARTSTGSHRAVGPSSDAIRLIPAPRPPAPQVPAPRPPASRPAAVVEAPTAVELPTPRRRLRRRPSVLLGALVAGGVVAGALGLHDGLGRPAEAKSVLAAQEALLGEDQLEAMPMASITVAEAQARLDEVAASRQERADAKAAAEAARLAAIEAARPKTVMPVDGATLTSGFGPRWGTYHYGIDLAAPMHTPEYAAADGVVLRAGSASGFGLAVYILHESGDMTVYGHMDEILVSPGDYVEAGDTIALLGNTGQSTGPHLHFEVHQGGEGGTKIDPIGWLRGRGVDI